MGHWTQRISLLMCDMQLIPTVELLMSTTPKTALVHCLARSNDLCMNQDPEPENWEGGSVDKGACCTNERTSVQVLSTHVTKVSSTEHTCNPGL